MYYLLKYLYRSSAFSLGWVSDLHRSAAFSPGWVTDPYRSVGSVKRYDDWTDELPDEMTGSCIKVPLAPTCRFDAAAAPDSFEVENMAADSWKDFCIVDLLLYVLEFHKSRCTTCNLPLLVFEHLLKSARCLRQM